jgi:tetratricopeptide (TPR) repeat protein
VFTALDYYGPMSLLISTSYVKCVLGLVLSAACGLAYSQTPVPAEPENSQLDSELFYELLVGEISAQSGDSSAAFSLFLDAARKSNSARLYERAIQVAIGARNGDAALQAAQAWTRAFPGAVDANRYLVQILVNLNRLGDTVAPLKRDMRQMVDSDKLATIEMLPRYFARASDRKLAALTVEHILQSETKDAMTGPLAWSVIGQLRMQASDIPGAVIAARNGATLNPLSVAPATLALALLQISQQDVESIVNRYLLGAPAPEYRMAYIRYLVGAERIKSAYEQTLLLNTQAPDNIDGWLLRGSLEIQGNKFVAADQALNKYLTLRSATNSDVEPQDMDRAMISAYVMLAQIAEQDGRFDEAMGYLKKIHSTTDSVRVGVRQAALLARQGKVFEAVALIRGLPENQPEAGRTKIVAEVQLLRDNGNPGEAYKAMEAAVLKFPEDADLKYDLAMMAEKAGKVEVMEQLMRQVIAAKPDYHAAYNALGYSLADRNVRLSEARQLVTKALEFSPKDPFIVDSLAWVEFRSGNVTEAARLLQGAFQERPDAEIAAHLGEVLWTLGQRDSAKAIWKEGFRLNPENATLLETTRRLNSLP